MLVLSGLSEADNKIKVLGLGADDYLTKPFDGRELVSRVQAIVRCAKGHSESEIHIGKLAVNLNTHSAEIEGRPLHLTSKEHSILELLCLRKGTTVTKETFLDHLYGGMDEPGPKIIDVFICKLRKKLGPARIPRPTLSARHPGSAGPATAKPVEWFQRQFRSIGSCK